MGGSGRDRLGGRAGRQRELEVGDFSLSPVHQLPAVGARDGPRDRQSQAGAVRFGREKRLEDLARAAGRHPFAPIGDPDPQAIPVLFDRRLDHRAVRRGLDGIPQDVVDGARPRRGAGVPARGRSHLPRAHAAGRRGRRADRGRFRPSAHGSRTIMSGLVLIVEDEPGLRQGLRDVVTAMGAEAVTAAGLGEARGIVAARPIDCVLLDIRLRDGDGLDYLGELRATAHGVPVIVATAYGDSERTIRAMRDGAFDYLTKPFDLEALRATIERALKQRVLARAAAPASDPPETRADLVGTSAAMLAIWKLIGRAAGSTAPVLITGETGTGKELVARAIHAYAPRARHQL